MAKIDPNSLELTEKVVSINRVSKTVKGGRIMKFAALVVVGDGNGTIGFGLGKSGEVPDAIRKGIEDAKKNLIKIPLKGTTIPHEIVGKFGAGSVLMKPAAPGTGVIAGGPVRAVIEVAGIKDIRTKSLRSNNPCNVVRATINGLASCATAAEVAEMRGKSVKEILGGCIMAKQIKLVKSLSGRKKDQVATANSLGLKKIGDVTVQPENAATLGKIQKISHLVEVQEA